MNTLYLDVATNRFHTDRKTGEEPHIVRIAAALDLPNMKERMVSLVRLPEGATIDPSTIRYHGAREAMLAEEGEPIGVLMAELSELIDRAQRIVCFNADFHMRQVEREAKRLDMALRPVLRVCLMELATPILKLPLMRPGGRLPSPTLGEAYHHFTGEMLLLDEAPMRKAAEIIMALKAIDDAILKRQDEGVPA